MPKSDFGLDALAALEQNDAHELIKIFRKSGAGAINATVQGDTYAGSGAFGRLKREEGDTMLHMALRNQKWLIRTACVTELAADCTIINKAGDSAPALAIQASLPRPGSALLATCAVHFEYVDLGNLMYYVLWAVSIVGLVDLFFSVRWYCVANKIFPFYWASLEKYKKQVKENKAKDDGKSSGKRKK